MSVTILEGDCRDALKTLPAESVHCCVTSPPYWNLRDYNVADAIGLEGSIADYISVIVAVFREVRRVLRKDGSAWVNLGDSYAANRTYQVTDNKHVDVGNKGGSTVPEGLKPKDLMLLPHRVAIALQDDGWWIRSDICWSKPNPMPESVRDRPTRAHEYVFLLAKSERYFYDADAIREPPSSNTHSRGGRDVPAGWNNASFLQGEGKGARTAANNPPTKIPDSWDTAPGAHGTIYREGRSKGAPADKQRGHSRRHAGFNDRWDQMDKEEQQINGANRRDVWTIAPEPYKGSHFATFPQRLAELCILAGCPVGGTVLDPFAGSGTTLAVALKNNRNSIGIELSPDYCQLIRQRIDGAQVRLPFDTTEEATA